MRSVSRAAQHSPHAAHCSLLPSPISTHRSVHTRVLMICGARQVCAVQLLWKVYGESGHECHPEGPLIRQFTRRGAQ